MSIGTITFSGLASGINTGELIDQLTKIEHRPIDLLQKQQSGLEAKLSLFNDLNTKLGALKTAATKLSLSTSFFVHKATSSDDSVLTAAAGSNASAGNHTVTVNSLARGTTQASANFGSSTAAVRQGTLAITVGTTTTNVTIDGTNNTLAGMRDAINASGAAVTASIVQVDATNYRLVVNGKNTGTANAVTIDETGLTTGADPLPGFGVTQAATDASLTVDGIPITRSSNVVSDVITGVSLDLKSSSASQLQVTVSNDTDAIKKQINDFVTAYNDVASFIHEQTKYDSENKIAGPLLGDSTMQTVQRVLRGALGTAVSGSPATLTEIGITTQSDDSLAVDDVKLSDALNNNMTGVSNLFLDATNGVAQRMMANVDSLTLAATGILTASIDGTQNNIDDLSKKIADKEANLILFQEDLTRRFAALEALVSQLKSQGQYLAQQLASLPQIT
ncbi:MAG TPA: flagellar filament capping protein FliD [Candidatus Binatia bacterium]|jgi:flagellar hook-associated protein 2